MFLSPKHFPDMNKPTGIRHCTQDATGFASADEAVSMPAFVRENKEVSTSSESS